MYGRGSDFSPFFLKNRSSVLPGSALRPAFVSHPVHTITVTHRVFHFFPVAATSEGDSVIY